MKPEPKITPRAYRVACQALPVLALIYPAAAQAYVGPGAGLTAVGTVIALTLALALAVVGFVWYPIKRLRQKRKADRHEPHLGDTPHARLGDTTQERK